MSVGAGAVIGGAVAGQVVNSLVQSITASALQEDAQKFESEQNQLNRDFTASQNALSRDWSSNENQLNRDFQDYLRSTAYQTQVEDMKKAGLNPALMSGTTALASASGGSSIGSGNSGAAASGSPISSARISDIFNSAIMKSMMDAVLTDEKTRHQWSDELANYTFGEMMSLDDEHTYNANLSPFPWGESDDLPF